MPESSPMSLAIVNARVWTGDPRRPWADAVLVRGAAIEAVGSSAEVKKRADAGTRIVDARGMTVASPVDGGILRAGSAADVVLLDRDLPRVTPDAVRAARVVLAISGGRVVEDVGTPSLQRTGDA